MFNYIRQKQQGGAKSFGITISAIAILVHGTDALQLRSRVHMLKDEMIENSYEKDFVDVNDNDSPIDQIINDSEFQQHVSEVQVPKTTIEPTKSIEQVSTLQTDTNNLVKVAPLPADEDDSDDDKPVEKKAQVNNHNNPQVKGPAVKQEPKKEDQKVDKKEEP